MVRKRKRSVHGSGSVYQRSSDGRWVAKFKVEETGRYKELYAWTEKEAYQKLQDALFEQKQGTLATGPQQTVKQFLEYWLEDVYKPKVRINSYEGSRVIVQKYLVPGMGHYNLQKLTARQVQSFYAKKLKEGISASRVRDINLVLHKALNHAKRVKLVGSNVCEGVELPSVERHKVQPLTEEQAHKLLQKAKEYHLEALLTLALATGMRRGEILGLKWQDVDLEKGLLWVRCTVHYVARHGFVEGKPKTASSDREIMLPRFVIDVLKQHRVVQLETRLKVGAAWIDRDLVFPSKDGDFMGPSTLLYHFSRLLKEAGLPHIRFHDLRHSAATLLLSMGVSMKVVQELLGHSNFSTTANVYSHVLSSMQKEAVEKMDGFLRWQQS